MLVVVFSVTSNLELNMAEGFSTDSYPKPPALPAQKSLLDQVGQYQDIAAKKQQYDRQDIALSQDKLKQINDQFGLMNNELSTLANDPSVTKESAAKRLNTFATTYGFKPEVTKHMIDELNASPDVKSFAQNALTRGMQTQEKVNNLYGPVSLQTNGQQNQYVTTSPLRGVTPVGAPFQQQIPPTQPVMGANNQPTLQGPTAPVAPPGIATLPGQRLPIQSNPVQTQRILPVGKGNLTNDGQVTGVSVQDQPVPNQQVQNRFPAPSGPAVGTPPMFEEGKKQLVEDQNLATQKLTGIKNAQKALALLPGVDSGPGTGPYQQALAFLKAQGVLSTDPKDKTVIYQEINKYLNRYVQQSGLSQRSDAAQALAENSNPNLMTQLNPALVNLTRNAIALDKVEAARPNAFQGKDYQNYGEHRSTFPQSQDERAYGLSDLPKVEAQKLYQSMKAKALAGDPEGIKFIKSLAIANKQGL